MRNEIKDGSGITLFYTVIMQNERDAEEAADTPAVQAKRPRWPVPVIAAGAAVVLVAASVGGWHVWTVRELAAAKSACATAADHTRDAMNAYNLLRDGDAAEASKTAKGRVKDANTLDTLADVLKAEVPEYADCTADSVKAKQDADAQAQAEAEQAAAAPPAPAYTGGGSRQDGTSAPASKPTPTPAPTPQPQPQAPGDDEYIEVCQRVDTSGKPGVWIPCS